MKKLMFLLPVAALALASCSSDSIVEQPATKVVSAEALQIYPELQGITRGTVWDNSNFTSFSLTTSGTFQTDKDNVDATDGTKQFSGETVNKTNGVWTIAGGNTETGAWYWPNKSASSDFTAWAPTTVTAGEYTASTTIDDQKDIVVAFNTGTASEFEAGVPLKFRHILSQIVVKADNADKNAVQIKVKGIRLNNISNKRTWAYPTSSTVDALPANVWGSTTASGEVNYVPTFAEITLDGSSQDITGGSPLLLIPQALGASTIGSGTGQYLSVLIQIIDLTKTASDKGYLVFPRNNCKGENSDPDYRSNGENGTEKWAWAAVDINTTWEAGKKYIYTLHFTKNGYGKIDGKTDGANTKPGDDNDNTTTDDPEPGDDVVDAPVPLVFDVEVIDWVDATDSDLEQNM